MSETSVLNMGIDGSLADGKHIWDRTAIAKVLLLA